MKYEFKVFEEVEGKEVKEEVMEVYFKLRSFGADIRLIACDKAGFDLFCGSILDITKDGIHRHTGVNCNLGFKITDGRMATN